MEQLNFIVKTELSQGETPNWKFFDFKGTAVPYKAITQQTVLTPAGIEIRDSKPHYINHLERCLEDFDPRLMSAARISILREMAIQMAYQMAFRSEVFEAPIAMSNKVPWGTVYVDHENERIILNEKQALDRYIDSDGDRAGLIFGDKIEGKAREAVLTKWPISMQPAILSLWYNYPEEKFFDLPAEKLKLLLDNNPVPRYKPGERKEAFIKSHTMVPVGLITNGHNCRDLYESKDMPFSERMEYIFNSHIDPETGKPERTTDLEDNGMKLVRKEYLAMQDKPQEIVDWGYALEHRHAPFLTSSGSISKMTKQLLDLEDADLEEIVNEIYTLDVDFREVKPGRQKYDTRLLWHDGNLLDRLMHIGLIRYEELGHENPDMPPAVLIWLSLPNGTPVGLTDVKRDQDEGMTFGFVLYPTYDNLDVYDVIRDESGEIIWEEDENGQAVPMVEIVAPAEKGFVHPIDHLRKNLGTFDCSVRAHNNAPVKRYWPQSWTDFTHPSKTVKLSNLYTWLLDYCGKQGDAIPCKLEGKVIDIEDITRAVAMHTVVIDYGTELGRDDIDGHWEVMKEAYSTAKLCLGRKPPQKSSAIRIGKYVLANEEGGAAWDKKCIGSLNRTGKIRSQLLRSFPLKSENSKLVIAIADFSTQHQALITPSGIKKQETDNVFLPRVFNTYEEYETFLQKAELTPDECPVNQVDYHFWNGEKRRCWTISARKMLRIGKLVDMYANKVVPRECPQYQYFDVDTMTRKNVDLIMPIQELIAKDALHAWIKNSKRVQLITETDDTTGEPITVWLVERQMFRTGAASENIPARWRRAGYKGIDQFPIANQVSKIKELDPIEVDLTFPIALQNALRELSSIVC